MTTSTQTIPHSRPWLTEADVEAVAAVVRSGYIAQGPETEAFEGEVAASLGVGYGVAVNSGTSALHLALRAHGVGSGDEVIIPSYVCTALYHAVCHSGATPVIVDSAERGYNLDAGAVHERLTARTKAVVVPHMFGFPAPVEEIVALGVPVLEDCALALGAKRRGRFVGTFGTAAICSFYATKLLATGEGGMVLTNDSALVERLRDLRTYDCRDELRVRYNCKMSDLHAALGRSQLRRYPEFLRRRRRIAKQYLQAFAELPIDLPDQSPSDDPAWYRFVLRLRTPVPAMLARLAEHGIMADRPVYRPIHQYLGAPVEEFPNSEALYKSACSVPLYPALRDDEIERVIAGVCVAVEACDQGAR